MAFLTYKMNQKKKAMGILIFDAMDKGAHQEAENIFLACKNDIDALQHHYALKMDEIEQLNEEGESEHVKRPTKQ